MLILLIWASTWPNAVQYTMLLHTELQSIMPKIDDDLGPVSISDKTSYHKIWWSLEVGRWVVWLIALFWNLTGTLAALLPRCLSKISEWSIISNTNLAASKTLQNLMIQILIRYWYWWHQKPGHQQVALWTHKRHLIPCPDRQGMLCLLWVLWNNLFPL